MNIETFKRALAQADEIAKTTDYADFVSIDAIVTMCYMELRLQNVGIGSNVAVAINDHSSENTVPGWFTDVLSQMGENRVTSSMVLKRAGKPSGIGELRKAGAWLRKLYGEPMRSNGQIIFIVPGSQSDSTEEEDTESADHPDIPLASKISTFAAKNTGNFTAKEIATAMRLQGTADELKLIWDVMTGLKKHMNASGQFMLSYR